MFSRDLLACHQTLGKIRQDLVVWRLFELQHVALSIPHQISPYLAIRHFYPSEPLRHP